MDAVKTARERFKKYPVFVAQCHQFGAKYAACVIAKSNLQRNDCEIEFRQFKDCIVKAAAKANMRL